MYKEISHFISGSILSKKKVQPAICPYFRLHRIWLVRIVAFIRAQINRPQCTAIKFALWLPKIKNWSIQ